MVYLLDTNAVSDLMRGDVRLKTWLAGMPEGDRIVTCTTVRGEILFGISRLPEGKRRSDLESAGRRILEAIPCEPIPAIAGDYYAAIKLARYRKGLVLDENDLWVAATAVSLGATLVSRDHDFTGIDGLRVFVP